MTGGEIEAGFHEVVVTEKTLEAAEKAKKDGRSLWRVSSTMFSQIRLDEVLEPLGQFSDKERREMYPPTVTYEQVADELKNIGLMEVDDHSHTKKTST